MDKGLYLGGTGSEVMRRIAAPMVGGMVSATILTLIVIPTVYLLWQQNKILNQTFYENKNGGNK